jgi:hypothetical protein
MQPIDIKEAVDNVAEYTTQILRRNRALVDYYIYPHTTPTEIEAYEPRLKALETRIKNLKKLNFSKLRQLIDDPDGLAAFYLLQIIVQLQNAIFGFKRIFEEHYDPSLSQRAPYSHICERLGDIEIRLNTLREDHQRERNLHRAEYQQSTASSTRFCTGAVQLINYSDTGKLGQVEYQDLFEVNKEVLQHHGGCFLWWSCTSCDFRLRYHVRASMYSSILNNDDIREHSGIPMEYRSAFMAKSHLFNPQFDSLPKGAPKYGCLFCYAQGKALDHDSTAFATGKDLATHICSSHNSTLPPPLLLSALNMAVNGKLPENCKRFDANLHTK